MLAAVRSFLPGCRGGIKRGILVFISMPTDRSLVRNTSSHSEGSQKLLRRIGPLLLTLYGLSVTVGAGVYVLIGEVVARAGIHAPLAFLAAGGLVALSAASYAELASRYPVSAGEAAYVRQGFGPGWLALGVGLIVCATGIVSSAALLRGGAGYIQEFFAAPGWQIQIVSALLIFGIASWGISQTAWTAAVLAVVEIGVLVTIAVAGLSNPAQVATAAAAAFSLPELAQIFGISSAILLAFFAFIGFEDMVNVAEEVKRPESTIPIAIGATLLVTTVLYVLVVLVAMSHVPMAELAASKAPLTLLSDRLLALDGRVISAVAVMAVFNGVLVQVVMSSRVLYGLSRMGALPALFGSVSEMTRTPVIATIFVMLIVVVLSLMTGTAALADFTSTLTLIVFATVNLSLWRLKREGIGHAPAFRVASWVPVLGFLSAAVFLAFEWTVRIASLAH
jgi:basic amino acid/polyamine antiporter, APA family